MNQNGLLTADYPSFHRRCDKSCLVGPRSVQVVCQLCEPGGKSVARKVGQNHRTTTDCLASPGSRL
jgi:hypothetical protein